MVRKKTGVCWETGRCGAGVRAIDSIICNTSACLWVKALIGFSYLLNCCRLQTCGPSVIVVGKNRWSHALVNAKKHCSAHFWSIRST